MDKDFERKVKQKRLRTIGVAVVAIVAAVYLIAGTKLEKADYTDSLKKEIQAAQKLYEECQDLKGNGAGQYAAYTLLKFEKEIERAEAAASDESSTYNEKKKAYELLQEQIAVFKHASNDPVLEKTEVQQLMKTGEQETLKRTDAAGKEIVYMISGERLQQAVGMNLMAETEGPYFDEIMEILAEKRLQGQTISFYQEGSFGGKIGVQVPFYSEDEEKGYVYKVNLEKGVFDFVSTAEVDPDTQTASFEIESGGDYVVLTQKLHRDKSKESEKEDAGLAEQDSDNTGSAAQEAADSASEELAESGQDGTETKSDSAALIEEEKDADEKTVAKVEEDRDESSVSKGESALENGNASKDEASQNVEDIGESKQEEKEPVLDGEKEESSVTIEDIEPQEDQNDSVKPQGETDELTVSIDIRCDTLAADLSKLRDPSLKAYVPADGVILSMTNVEIEEGASVYDVLDMVCRDKGIHMEAVYTPSYGADYIEGINYLYEFDAGEQSGWMYMVNGIVPNYGCSDYILEDGDHVVWAYTCDMGKDLEK